jgi:hypothetical protein
MDSTTWKNFRILSVGVWALFILGMILTGSNGWTIIGIVALVMDQIIGHMYAKHLENIEEVAALEEMNNWEDKYDEDEHDDFEEERI